MSILGTLRSVAPPEAIPTVLFVCTANICRSPMAEAILAARVGALREPVRARSAGVHAVEAPPSPLAQEVLADRGLDLSAHVAQRVTNDRIADAKLVLTMERGHVAAVVALAPEAFSRTFGLTEIVRLGEQHEARGADEELDAWLARLHAGRRPSDVLRADSSFDITDPYGGSRADYEKCVDRLTHLIDALVVLVGRGAPV